MNPKLETIFKRRSARAYTDDPIDDAAVHDLLEAAMAAPSARACDPWHFIVVRKRATREKIADILPYGKMIGESPVAIVVCGDLEKAHGRQLSYLLQDCAAAIENILLAATGIGLATCWCGIHPREERIDGIKKLFDLPQNIIPISAIAVGHAGCEIPPRTRYNEDAVHFEKW